MHTLDPEVTSYGASNLDLTVNGPMAQPAISGRINIEHGGLSMIDLPAGLGDINGSLVFNQDRLEVEHLTARTGGGLVTFGGFITYGRTIGFNLTANGNEIRFRYAGISVTADETLRLVGTLQNSTLSGDVTVTRFAQIPSNDLAFALAQASPAPVPVGNSPLNNLRLDVRILSTPELTVQTALAKLAGDVDLRLRGTAARPSCWDASTLPRATSSWLEPSITWNAAISLLPTPCALTRSGYRGLHSGSGLRHHHRLARYPGAPEHHLSL